MNLNTDL